MDTEAMVAACQACSDACEAATTPEEVQAACDACTAACMEAAEGEPVEDEPAPDDGTPKSPADLAKFKASLKSQLSKGV